MTDPTIEGAERSKVKVAKARDSMILAEERFIAAALVAREAGDESTALWCAQRASEYASCGRMGAGVLAQLDLAIEARRRMDKSAFEAAMARARTLGSAAQEITERIALESVDRPTDTPFGAAQ